MTDPIKFCNTCVMPSTRPGSIFKNGKCQACINYENRNLIFWVGRIHQLDDLIRRAKLECPTGPNCLVPVSGGKDSYYLVHKAIEIGLTPILLRVNDIFTMSHAGKHNLEAMPNEFCCDMIEHTINPYVYRSTIVKEFNEYGNFPYVDKTIYSIPVTYAEKYSIPIILYGENPMYEYGTAETESMYDCMEMTSKLLDYKPTRTTPIFMSYFYPWDGAENYKVARAHGFKTLEELDLWKRHGNIENYDQIDSIGWQFSNYLKFLKFGFGRVTDIASRWIRAGYMTREEAIEAVIAKDGQLDPRIWDDFSKSTGINPVKVLNIADKFRNKDLFTEIGDYDWERKYLPS